MSEHSEYNDTAIDLAEKIHATNSANQKKRAARARSIEQVFPSFNRAGLGVALEYERMGKQPVSDALLASAAKLGARFEHLGITLGTVIHGINLKQALPDELIEFIRNTLLERKVIFFRDQHLSADEQVAFGRRFGELDAFPFGKPGSNPYILEIVHDDQAPGTENGFHTDVTWMEQPSLGSIAQCVELPPFGGDTLFSDSHACYLGLPADLQARIEHLDGVNDYRYFFNRNGSLPEALVEEIKARVPFGVTHPLVRSHPETGKRALYLNAAFLRHDSLHDRRTGETLPKAESVALAQALAIAHQRPEYGCRFCWQPGSIAFWDNRAVQHYAASDYYPHRRVLRRVTVSGDRPYYLEEPGQATSSAAAS